MNMPSVDQPLDFRHLTVLREETVSGLALRRGGTCVDLTLGGGGHSEAVLTAYPAARVIGFDRDPKAIAAASERLSPYGDRVSISKARFSEVEAELFRMGIDQVDALIADLGVSSPQLDAPDRGMSF